MTRDEIIADARDLGFDLAGICDPSPPEGLEFTKRWIEKGYAGDMEYMERSLPLRADLNSILPGVRSVIVCGLNYYVLDEDVDAARVAKYARGRDYHKVIRKKLKALASLLDAKMPAGTHRPCVDSAPVFEREYAQRAGLGWFGKNTCLIHTRQGSWFLIGVLLTTLELDKSVPAVGGCGTCTACIDACPTTAILFEDGRWQVDSRRCISYLTIEKKDEIDPDLQPFMDDWVFGCDVCQAVCPFNHPRENAPARAKVTSEIDFLDRRPWPTAEEIIKMTESEWDLLTRGTAVRRAGFSGLRRNAAIALRNRQSRKS